jgi:hypothetical protein
MPASASADTVVIFSLFISLSVLNLLKVATPYYYLYTFGLSRMKTALICKHSSIILQDASQPRH